MRTNTEAERTFSFTDLSEDEAMVLRTLLNLNEHGVRKALESDEAYWDHRLDEEEAVAIGVELTDEVMAVVDNHV